MHCDLRQVCCKYVLRWSSPSTAMLRTVPVWKCGSDLLELHANHGVESSIWHLFCLMIRQRVELGLHYQAHTVEKSTFLDPFYPALSQAPSSNLTFPMTCLVNMPWISRTIGCANLESMYWFHMHSTTPAECQARIMFRSPPTHTGMLHCIAGKFPTQCISRVPSRLQMYVFSFHSLPATLHSGLVSSALSAANSILHPTAFQHHTIPPRKCISIFSPSCSLEQRPPP